MARDESSHIHPVRFASSKQTRRIDGSQLFLSHHNGPHAVAHRHQRFRNVETAQVDIRPHKKRRIAWKGGIKNLNEPTNRLIRPPMTPYDKKPLRRIQA